MAIQLEDGKSYKNSLGHAWIEGEIDDVEHAPDCALVALYKRFTPAV